MISKEEAQHIFEAGRLEAAVTVTEELRFCYIKNTRKKVEAQKLVERLREFYIETRESAYKCVK